MLGLFEGKKRQLLGKENLKTYLAFIIGEFLLVIFGILIALQIDNWNENRKTRKSEVKYLAALQDEVSNNLDELQRVMNLCEENATFAVELSRYTDPSESELTEIEFDTLLLNSINTEVQYRPSIGVFEEIINSGKLEMISNDRLRYEIASWESIMQQVRFQEQEHSRVRYNLIDLFYSSGNFRKALYNLSGERHGVSETKFKGENRLLLQSIEFDNQLITFIYTAKSLNLNYYSILEDRLNEVLLIIENELNDVVITDH